MISPHVRRLRLGRELQELRESAELTIVQFSKRLGYDRTKLSRLENGRTRPAVDEVIKILDAVGVDGERWTQLVNIAREAAERGWWESYKTDERQALYCDLEAGAETIREYQQSQPPGLLQIEEFTHALTVYDDAGLAGASPPDPKDVLQARAGRQRMLRRPGGPTYEVIIDEVIARRLSAPREILTKQLRRLTDTGDSISVRVLPTSAEIAGYSIPKSPFSLYTYPDPDDPKVAAVNTLTSDLILTDVRQVESYEQLYTRLRESALSPPDSAALLTEAANEIEKRGDQS